MGLARELPRNKTRGGVALIFRGGSDVTPTFAVRLLCPCSWSRLVHANPELSGAKRSVERLALMSLYAAFFQSCTVLYG